MRFIFWILLWGFVFYTIFKAVGRFLRHIAQSAAMSQRNSEASANSSARADDPGRRKYNINNKDIIDADFVEIKTENKQNSEAENKTGK